jgi:hypothetical protein
LANWRLTEVLFRATSLYSASVGGAGFGALETFYTDKVSSPPTIVQRRRNAQFPPINSLTRELEKKLSDKYIVFLSQRRVLPKEKRNSNTKLGQKRPRSRTLTAVHEKMLEDLVFPSEIVGKRTRVAADGSKLIRVYLDAKDQNQLEYKLDTFSSVYRSLAGKDVVFEFPVQAAE